MSRSLYVTALEANSGKSLVSLGLADMLVRRVERLAFFRPAIRSRGEPDNDTLLMRIQYCQGLDYDSMYAVTHDEARELYLNDQYEQLLKRILAKHQDLEGEYDFVLCEGSDFTGFSSALEFDFNAKVANHLGCPIVVVVSGVDKDVPELLNASRAAREAFENEGCTIAALIANRVQPDQVADFRQRVQEEWDYAEPLFAIPEHESLGRPTIGEIHDRIIEGQDKIPRLD